jgi:hypothetical protein
VQKQWYKYSSVFTYELFLLQLKLRTQNVGTLKSFSDRSAYAEKSESENMKEEINFSRGAWENNIKICAEEIF